MVSTVVIICKSVNTKTSEEEGRKVFHVIKYGSPCPIESRTNIRHWSLMANHLNLMDHFVWARAHTYFLLVWSDFFSVMKCRRTSLQSDLTGPNSGSISQSRQTDIHTERNHSDWDTTLQACSILYKANLECLSSKDFTKHDFVRVERAIQLVHVIDTPRPWR